ncbi:MAG: hypothetical protein KDE26_04705 [Bacteroidetes bacterium]|nr:hypothetical protein [Bacteroidota bacterium]
MKTTYCIWVFFILTPFFTFSQEIYKSGYIIDKNGEKISGQIRIESVQDPYEYYQKVVFKKGNKITEYLPDQIKEFGIGNSHVFRAFTVPMLDKNHLVQDHAEMPRFLRQMNDGSLILYDLRMENRYWSFYYTKDDGEIQPLKMTKKEAENLRTETGSYRLSENLEINDPVNGAVYKTETRFFLFDKGMFELVPHFKQILIRPLFESGCDISFAETIMEPDHRAIYNYMRSLQKCQKLKDNAIKKKGTRLNVSVLAMGSTLPGIQSTFEKQRAIGGLIEIKELNFSSRVSLAYGRFLFSEGFSYYLDDYIVNSRPTFRTDTMEMKITGISNLLRLGYHFRPQKNVRPFLYAGIQRFRLEGTVQDTQELRQVKEVELSVHGANVGVGLDYYFLNINQLRLQVGYAKGFEYFIGYGLNLTK